MTDPTAGALGAPAPEQLQFDRAERAFHTAGSECAVCKQPITTSYFEINGKIACASCRGRILAAWNRGSPAQRGAKAAALGTLAAALGATHPPARARRAPGPRLRGADHDRVR